MLWLDYEHLEHTKAQRFQGVRSAWSLTGSSVDGSKVSLRLQVQLDVHDRTNACIAHSSIFSCQDGHRWSVWRNWKESFTISCQWRSHGQQALKCHLTEHISWSRGVRFIFCQYWYCLLSLRNLAFQIPNMSWAVKFSKQQSGFDYSVRLNGQGLQCPLTIGTSMFLQHLQCLVVDSTIDAKPCQCCNWYCLTS